MAESLTACVPRWTVITMMIVVGGLISIPSVVASEQKPPAPWKVSPRRARKKNPIAADDRSIAVGKTVYRQQCLACHGKTGKGDGPAAADLEVHPGDLSHPKTWQQTDGALYWKITTGRAPMPSYKKLLSDEQRWHVVNYIRTLAPRPAPGSTPGNAPESTSGTPGMAPAITPLPFRSEAADRVAVTPEQARGAKTCGYYPAASTPEGALWRQRRVRPNDGDPGSEGVRGVCRTQVHGSQSVTPTNAATQTRR